MTNTMTFNVRSYSEMMQFDTFEERFEYLKLRSSVGASTFGFDRVLNQQFYTSAEWKRARRQVLVRDMGRDLGIPGFEIFDKPIIHHMNPMRVEDVDAGDPDIINPEYLITVSLNTHNAIHFGDKRSLTSQLVERRPGDTTPWR